MYYSYFKDLFYFIKELLYFIKDCLIILIVISIFGLIYYYTSLILLILFFQLVDFYDYLCIHGGKILNKKYIITLLNIKY